MPDAAHAAMPAEVESQIRTLYMDAAKDVSPAATRMRHGALKIFYDHMERQISAVRSKEARDKIYRVLSQVVIDDQMQAMVQGYYDPSIERIVIAGQLKGTMMSLVTLLHTTRILISELTDTHSKNPLRRIANFFDYRPGFWRTKLAAYGAEHDLVSDLLEMQDPEISFVDLVLEEFEIPPADRKSFRLLFEDMRFEGRTLVRNEHRWRAVYQDPERIQRYQFTPRIHQIDLSLQKIYPIKNADKTEYACAKALATMNPYQAGEFLRGLILLPIKVTVAGGGTALAIGLLRNL